jgi:hypothetical protein
MACAMQPQAANAMPDILAVCQAMRRQVDPERIRMVVIDPRQDGLPGPQLSRLAIDGIRRSGVEVVWLDGNHSLGRHPNGLLLADFFDFT